MNECPCVKNRYDVSTDIANGEIRCAYCRRLLSFYRTADYNILHGWLDTL